MFLQFYGFREQPFGVTPNPRYLYHSPAHREALASLIYGIEANLGFSALVAEPGMGKTTLLYYLLEKFRIVARTAFVFQTQCDRIELLRYIANELEIRDGGSDPVILNDRIRDVLISESRAHRRVIVIIDEAQNLTESALETIRLLSDFESPDVKLMHIVLAGQPQLAEMLARPTMVQLLQRIAIVNKLLPFPGVQQVSEYLDHRLAVAGYKGPSVFTSGAIQAIAKYSSGVPRQINRICFNALSLGCATNNRRIDEQIVSEVIQDLDIGLASGQARVLQTVRSENGQATQRDPNSKSPVALAAEPAPSPLSAQKLRAHQSSTVAPVQHIWPNLAETMHIPSVVNTRPVASVQSWLTRTGKCGLNLSTGPEHHQSSREARETGRAPRKRSSAASIRSVEAKPAAMNKIVASAVKPPCQGMQVARSKRADSRRQLILVSVIAIPLLLLTLWFYWGQHLRLPSAGKSTNWPVEHTAPPAADRESHGRSVDLPSPTDSPGQQ